MRAIAFKKLVGAVTVAVVLCAGSASAQLAMSAGIGGAFRNNFGGGVEYCEWGYGCEESPSNWIGGGLNAFFDITYAEFNLGMTFSNHSQEESWRYGMNDYGYSKFSLSLTSFDIGVFGKYPVDLGNMTIFPMAGIDYRIVLSGSYTNEDTGYDGWDGYYYYSYKGDLGKGGAPKAGKFSRLWLKFGAGMDVPLTETIFLRSKVLYGIGLANKFENDEVDNAKRWGGWGETLDVLLSHGFDIRVGVGFMF